MLNAWLLISSDEESENEGNRRIKKTIRDNSNPMELQEGMFIKLFRINKESFRYLLTEMEPFFKKIVRSSSIPNSVKIAAALRFLAEGGYQKGVGEEWNVGLSQQSVSTVLEEFLKIFEEHICPKWIQFPRSQNEKTSIKRAFFQKYNIPNVIGCVDGTHVRIIAPSEDEHIFFNRKGYHSINIMIACDNDMRIRAIDSRYGGAAHDSHVWMLSSLREHLNQNWADGERSWLLGDSGYPLEPWIITPYRSAPEGSRESAFNTLHSKCRCIVERTIGLWKTRFRCIHRELHYKPKKAAHIANAAAALHNICLHFNAELTEENIEIPNENYIEYHGEREENEARRIRDQILNSSIN